MLKRNKFMFLLWLTFGLFGNISPTTAKEHVDLIVARDGSGDFTTIQAAINAVPRDNDALKIILIKNGVYVERLMIKTNFIAPVGEDRDSTRIRFFQPYSFDSTYAENIEFFCTRKTTPLWHDGSKNHDQKLVVKNAAFDGATEFRLARNHHDGAFYLLNCVFSEKLINQPFYRPESSPAPYKWGRRDYFHNCVRPAGNYEWHKDNLISAPGSPQPEDITPAWTFAGAWNPEVNLPSVLPMAFLPKPDNNKAGVALTPKLTWIAGRNAKSHKIYFATSNPPQFVAEVRECAYQPSALRPHTTYYWRVDEVTDEKVIEGKVWQFRTL